MKKTLLALAAVGLAGLAPTGQAQQPWPFPLVPALAPGYAANPYLPMGISPYTYTGGGVPVLPVLPFTSHSNPWLQYAPTTTFGFFNPVPKTDEVSLVTRKPYTMRRIIPKVEKTQMMHMMIPMIKNFFHMDMPEGMNYFAHKIKAKPGLSFDDVVEYMLLRANQLNFKFVGANYLWKDFHALLGDTEAPRIEVFSFCDIAVARELLKISPEFAVFLPCRIVVMEDGDKNVWLMMIDWDMNWVAGYEREMGLSDELVKGSYSVFDNMVKIMEAGANGEMY